MILGRLRLHFGPQVGTKNPKMGGRMFTDSLILGLFQLFFSLLRYRCSTAGAGALFGGLRAASWPTLVRFWALLEAALGKFSPIFSVLAALAGGAAPPGLPAAKTSENN